MRKLQERTTLVNAVAERTKKDQRPEETEGEKQEPLSLAEFFESVPPNTWVTVSEVALFQPSGKFLLGLPEIRLFCTNDACNGHRFFSTSHSGIYLSQGKSNYEYVIYTCRNCLKHRKLFSLWFTLAKDQRIPEVLKFGEYPEFGPPTPSRVITLIGPDRDLFLKGRRSENQGLGIGAFGYYRRVVENQKNRILGEILKVSEKLGAGQELLAEIAAAQKESQFTKAIERIKHALPQALLINGQNPLLLLHAALSEGLHNRSDQECLGLASSIRVVLSELAERFGQALKDEAELHQALSRLLQIKEKKGRGE